MMSEQKDNKKKISLSKPLIIQSVFFAVLILALAILVFKSSAAVQKVSNPAESSTASLEEIKPPEELEPVATPEPTPEPTPEGPLFKPYATETTDPARLLKLTGISVDGVEVAVGEYAEPEPIDFPLPEEYSSLKGITTFRGNNFRDGGNYGTAEINEKKLNLAWTLNTTSLVSPDGNVWSGIGWTGQPLIVEWPKETRALMNMEGWAKEKDVLIEVISPTMGGKIQFCELESGKKTRADIDVGFPFKGTGTLDPRGYPLLYIGSGYHSSKGTSRVFIISLVDGSILHSFGTDDPFAIRPWPMFDSAPLVDGKTDRLIYPGENGLIYIIKLNAAFDKETGKVSVAPGRTVKWKYNTHRMSLASFWLGFEASPVIWEGQLIISDNGGMLICLDLNTLQVNWVQDILDDSNCTPVLEIEDGKPYLYISTSFHGGWRAPMNSKCDVPLFKIDATTGEVVWRKDYACYTESAVSGGVQGSVASGRHNVSDLVFFPVARTPKAGSGVLAALDKKTGDVVWEFETKAYSWSSPTMIYDQNGDGYIIYPTFFGMTYLLDARTGSVLDKYDINGHTEASPAVYGNYAIIGHRNEKTFCFRIS